MDQKKIDRINELARKSKTPEGLTAAEQAERQALRQEYIQADRNELAAEAAAERLALVQYEQNGKGSL